MPADTLSSSSSLLVEIVEALGSTPRKAGTWMLVGEDWTQGTIGGGALEFRAIERAREWLIEGLKKPIEIELPLGPSLSQCCGGYVRLRLRPSPDEAALTEMHQALQSDWPTIYLFGAGHVGKAIVRALSDLPMLVCWIDGRADQFPLTIPENVTKFVMEEPEALLEHVPKTAPVLVMTHDHALDLEICSGAIARGHQGLLGLIGSKSKKARFFKQISARGLDPSSITCPIGLQAIDGKEPAVIAASVAAQLLMNMRPKRGR